MSDLLQRNRFMSQLHYGIKLLSESLQQIRLFMLLLTNSAQFYNFRMSQGNAATWWHKIFGTRFCMP